VDLSKNESLWFVVQICLITGARWSEAIGLTYSNCINSGFQFVDTKNGHSRFVPVDFETFDTVRSRLAKGPFFLLLCCLPFCNETNRHNLS
jgi:integrase